MYLFRQVVRCLVENPGGYQLLTSQQSSSPPSGMFPSDLLHGLSHTPPPYFLEFAHLKSGSYKFILQTVAVIVSRSLLTPVENTPFDDDQFVNQLQ
jgi:hypothetical protein